MLNFEEYCEAGLRAPTCEGFPFQALQHVSYGAGVVMALKDEACCSPLHHFQFLGVFFVVRIPDGGTVLQDWADNPLVRHFFQRLALSDRKV